MLYHGISATNPSYYHSPPLALCTSWLILIVKKKNLKQISQFWVRVVEGASWEQLQKRECYRIAEVFTVTVSQLQTQVAFDLMTGPDA